MASKILYPPIVDSYMPAFQASGSCKVYFSLSRFNGSSDFDSVQVSVMKQSNGLTVINDVTNGEGCYRTNGKIILNKSVATAKDDDGNIIDNLYYFILNKDDIKYGQQVGWLYKVQFRLVEKDCGYKGTGEIGDQNNYLIENASHFSEQSTVCVLKSIGTIDLILAAPFKYNSSEVNQPNENVEGTSEFDITTLDIYGNIVSGDPSEKLYSYQIKIQNLETENLIEDSGILFSNNYQDSNEFHYLVKREFNNGERCLFKLEYCTINGYKGEYEKRFQISDTQSDGPAVKIITLETNDIDEDTGLPYFGTDSLNDMTSISEEEEQGRIGLKIVPTSKQQGLYSGNLCIRRASEKDNFETWTDIKIIVVNEEYIKDLDIIYDYTIESGVYYRYGIQEIDRDGFRTKLITMDIDKPVMREFEYSFLLGEGGKQLRLMFDNTMSSYKIQQLESKVETIGGKYPIITRNAAVEYRIFPITGLISFQMDEDNLFCSMKDIYKYTKPIEQHANGRGDHYNITRQHLPTYQTPTDQIDTFPAEPESPIDPENDDPQPEPPTEENKVVEYKHNRNSQYDYTYERDFRKMVLDFLHDGKPKLFKSPTEGNIIVRLTDISCTPNQTLDRMIYSFTANGNEFADATMENYIKYGFHVVGNYATSFGKTYVKLGQLTMDFDENTNIIKEIYKKYSKEKENIAGYSRKIQNIFGIRITINDKPLKVLSNGGYTLGNGMEVSYNGVENQKIIIFNGIYEFDSRIKFSNKSTEKIILLGPEKELDEDGKLISQVIKTVNATVDFFYEMVSVPYNDKRILSREAIRSIGQIYNSYTPGTKIHNEIIRKNMIDSNTIYRKVNRITSIEIESNPGVVFRILDKDDTGSIGEEHDINTTGLLNLYNLNDITSIVYAGIRKPDGTIDDTVKADIMINYHCIILQGAYKQNE